GRAIAQHQHLDVHGMNIPLECPIGHLEPKGEGGDPASFPGGEDEPIPRPVRVVHSGDGADERPARANEGGIRALVQMDAEGRRRDRRWGWAAEHSGRPEGRREGHREQRDRLLDRAGRVAGGGGTALRGASPLPRSRRRDRGAGGHPDAREPEPEVIRWALTIGAVLAWVFGAMLVLVPGPFFAPIGIVMTDKIATIAQNQGAALIAIGVIDFLARGTTDRTALRAVLVGNLVIQVLSLLVAIRALALGAFPPQ